VDPIAAGVACSIGSAIAARRFAARHAVVAIGLGYGAAHFVGQGKGWSTICIHSRRSPPSRSSPSCRGASKPGRLAALPLLACIVAAGAMLGFEGRGGGRPRVDRGKERRVSAIAAGLEGRIAREDFVQVLDTTEAGIHALLRLRAVQPTRFIYDFHFYHDVETRTVRRLREEFLAGFDAHPPKFVLLFERGWPAGGYERVETFPASGAGSRPIGSIGVATATSSMRADIVRRIIRAYDDPIVRAYCWRGSGSFASGSSTRSASIFRSRGLCSTSAAASASSRSTMPRRRPPASSGHRREHAAHRDGASGGVAARDRERRLRGR